MIRETPPVEPEASRPHMPGYGLLAADEGQGLLPWSWAEQRLTASRRYWLATVWPDGRPHVAPVWGVWFEGRFFFSTGGRSRKTINLRADAACVVTTEDAIGPVIIDGTASAVTDPDRLQTVIEAYSAKYADSPPDPVENPIFEVTPIRAIGLAEDEAHFTASATRWTFPT